MRDGNVRRKRYHMIDEFDKTIDDGNLANVSGSRDTSDLREFNLRQIFRY